MIEDIAWRLFVTFFVVMLTPKKKDLSTSLFKNFNFEYKSKNRTFKVEYREQDRENQ